MKIDIIFYPDRYVRLISGAATHLDESWFVDAGPRPLTAQHRMLRSMSCTAHYPPARRGHTVSTTLMLHFQSFVFVSQWLPLNLLVIRGRLIHPVPVLLGWRARLVLWSIALRIGVNPTRSMPMAFLAWRRCAEPPHGMGSTVLFRRPCIYRRHRH